LDHVKTAAFGWTLWPERADDHVASGLHGLGHVTDISHTCVGCCKKMKNGAVMPYIVRTRVQAPCP
jgi:hypothetical protein